MFGGNPSSQWQDVVAKLKTANPGAVVSASQVQPDAVYIEVKPGESGWNSRVGRAAEELDDLTRTTKSLRVRDQLTEIRQVLMAARSASSASESELDSLRRQVKNAKHAEEFAIKNEKKAKRKYKALKAQEDRKTEKMHEALELAEDYRQQLEELKEKR
jgi:chromosome segregation ATPase